MQPPLSAIFREELAELTAYVPKSPPGIQIRLDANEAPPCNAPELRAALRHASEEVWLERYPDPRAVELRAALAERWGCNPDELVVGTGSDELIALLATACARPRAGLPQPVLLTPTPTFVMYRVTGRVHGFKVVEVPLDRAWRVDVPAMARAIDVMKPNVIFVATPNNPTGVREARESLAALARAAGEIGALVVVDEAYGDFATESGASLRAEYPNVAILRTLSKIGLAALRIGALEAGPEVVAALDKSRQPFNVDGLAQAATVRILRDAKGAVDAHVASIRSERARVFAALAAMDRVEALPSEANFHWLRTARPAGEVWQALVEQGILVRSFHERGGRLAHQLRVTVGSPGENDRFLEAIARCAG
jgi:histidinol-phosphate aminotransferase